MTVSFFYLQAPEPGPHPATLADELLRVAIALNEGNTPEQLIDILFDTLGDFVPIDRIGLAMLGPDDVLESRYVRSRGPVFLRSGARAPIHGSSLEPIVRERKLRIIADLEAYAAEHPSSWSTQLILKEGMRSSLTLPLIVRDRPLGILFLSSTRPDAYRAEHANFIRAIALTVAAALERGLFVGELRRANEDLRELDQLKTNFLSNLSHELRTPLSEVLSYAYALDDEVAGAMGPDQHQYLHRILAGAKRLESLLTELFDYTALESGAFTLERVPVDLGPLALEVAEECRPAIEASGLELTVETAPSSVNLEGDPPRLAQVLRILLSNARKFTPAPGRVTLRTGAEEGRGWVEVEDTGIGIPEDQQPRIFQRFFQVEGDAGRSYGGTGLGLALAKAIAEAHGGTLTFRSRPGEGSVFRLSLSRT